MNSRKKRNGKILNPKAKKAIEQMKYEIGSGFSQQEANHPHVNAHLGGKISKNLFEIGFQQILERKKFK